MGRCGALGGFWVRSCAVPQGDGLDSAQADWNIWLGFPWFGSLLAFGKRSHLDRSPNRIRDDRFFWILGTENLLAIYDEG